MRRLALLCALAAKAVGFSATPGTAFVPGTGGSCDDYDNISTRRACEAQKVADRVAEEAKKAAEAAVKGDGGTATLPDTGGTASLGLGATSGSCDGNNLLDRTACGAKKVAERIAEEAKRAAEEARRVAEEAKKAAEAAVRWAGDAVRAVTEFVDQFGKCSYWKDKLTEGIEATRIVDITIELAGKIAEISEPVCGVLEDQQTNAAPECRHALWCLQQVDEIKNIHKDEIEPIFDGFCEAFNTEWAIIKADVDAVLDDVGQGLRNVWEKVTDGSYEATLEELVSATVDAYNRFGTAIKTIEERMGCCVGDQRLQRVVEDTHAGTEMGCAARPPPPPALPPPPSRPPPASPPRYHVNPPRWKDSCEVGMVNGKKGTQWNECEADDIVYCCNLCFGEHTCSTDSTLKFCACKG